MSIERIQFGKHNGSPQEHLSELMNQLEMLLSQLIKNKNYLIYDDMQPILLEVWPEIEIRFKKYIKLVTKSDSNDLKVHGLTGKELDLKIDSINFAAGYFFHSYKNKNEKLARKWLKKTLEIIDIVFKSLLKVVPGGGAIEEYKNICESLIPDDNQD